jgi:hypothetical protein
MTSQEILNTDFAQFREAYEKATIVDDDAINTSENDLTTQLANFNKFHQDEKDIAASDEEARVL